MLNTYKKAISLSNCSILLFTLLSCSKLDVKQAENLYNGTVYVIGHGGEGFQSFNNPLPHNSMASIKRAIVNQAADGVELDVQVTLDGELVLYHDNDLQSMTWCNGLIGSTQSQEVLNCSFKMENLVNANNSEKIITLKEALVFFKNRSIEPIIFLDFKSHLFVESGNSTFYMQKIVDRMVEINSEVSLSRSINILANNNELNSLLKNELPQFRYWFGTQSIQNDITLAIEGDYYGFVVNNAFVTKQEVELAKIGNLHTAIFSMKSQSGILSAYKKNPEYLITDNINITRAITN